MTEYYYYTCPICGIQYAVDKVVMDYKNRTEDNKERGWHCPNGHPLVFRENNLDVMRRERDRLQQQLAERDDTIRVEREQREAAEKRERKLKKRAAAGVCPCCNRQFSALDRHMKTKHPMFAKDKPNLKVVA